jgi:peptidyl-prolyl cis-trans isomerase C
MALRIPLTSVAACAAGLAAIFAAATVPLAADPPAAAPNPSAPVSTPLPPGNTVVARVDGIEIRLADVEATRSNLPIQAQKLPFDQVYPILLDRLVDGTLLAEAGRKDHVDQDPELQRRIKRYQDQLIQEAYLNRAIKQAETEDRLKARYETFAKEKGREEVHARHILVKTEDEAKAVIAELDKGADFAALAKQHSTDPAANSGGDLGYFGHDDMIKEFADAAFALPVGQYSKTPLKTEFGWHVIKVEDHRTGKPPSFDEARKELAQLVARDVVAEKLKQLRGGAKIETFGLDGKPLPPAK